ncbi:hypothetical protein EUX98_g9305 [Antrodiella citrinella]|uniref:Uncharacterized protein n=1 Tax=Antrodiella citrinella TaxID=2447956 RepID=A0A4S4LW79_9APHY|nr:hypothetical protein EUX98_g9305 [Antrodiella citrinella]
MSSPTLVIAERADIHKSCKSIELLVNIFNDYCQVADTLVALQKKLAKALRDSASGKATASIPASAFLTTATLFDSLSDVDSKFVKLAEKECDSISNELRKWFKKLSKEEKIHDDKIASANTKIKQAGLLYEKKSKKTPRDAQDEHTRYITLLSVLGPEDLPELDPAEKEEDIQEPSLDKPAPEYSSRGPSEQDRMTLAQDVPPTKTNTVTSPPPLYSSPNPQPSDGDTLQSRDRGGPDTTLASLASFPAPPTHFPLPPVATAAATSQAPSNADSHTYLEVVPSQSRTTDAAGEEHGSARSAPASPVVDNVIRRPPVSPDASPRPQYSPAPNILQEKQGLRPEDTQTTETRPSITPRFLQDNAPLMESPNPSVHQFETPARELADEPRVIHQDDGPRRASEQSRTSESPRTMERTDTGKSNGSVVAALRDKYARSPTSSSNPKEIVRIPLSVSSLATRYDATGDVPPSPRSPERQRLSTDQAARVPALSGPERSPQMVKQIPSSSGDPSKVKQRTLDMEERERQLRAREEAMDRKTKEMEFEVYQIRRDLDRRPVDLPSNDHAPRTPVASRQQAYPPASSPRLVQQMHSYSATNLGTYAMPTTLTHYSRTNPSPLNSPGIGVPDHAPSCGCEACSASKYRTRDTYPSSRDLRPPEPPITLRPEKPKGWIRRLSMPVMGNAFSSDSKKGMTNLAIASSASSGPYRSSLALADEDGRFRYDLTGVKNRSTATLGR